MSIIKSCLAKSLQVRPSQIHDADLLPCLYSTLLYSTRSTGIFICTSLAESEQSIVFYFVFAMHACLLACVVFCRLRRGRARVSHSPSLLRCPPYANSVQTRRSRYSILVRNLWEDHTQLSKVMRSGDRMSQPINQVRKEDHEDGFGLEFIS